MCFYQWCWLCGSAYTIGHYTNPLGCMFLEKEGNKKKRWPIWKLYLYRLVCLIIFPFWLVFGDNCQMVWDKVKNARPAKRGCYFVLILLMGLIFIIFFIALLPLIILIISISYCSDKATFMRKHKPRFKKDKSSKI